MIFPTLVVVVACLLVVDASTQNAIAKVKTIRAKAMKGHNMFARKAGATALAVSPETTYATSGWMVQSVYSDNSCSTPSASQGYAVNTCYKYHDGVTTTSYMYQMTGNTCVGAVMQSFTDDACTTGMTSEDMGLTDGCDGAGQMATCSTASSPSVPYSAAVVTYYRSTDCSAATSLYAIPAYTCMDSTLEYQCSGSNVNFVEFTGADCSGTSTGFVVPNTCTTDDDDDDTNYYAPGDQSDTETIMCNNGASGLFNSMSVKAVAALVVGVVAFLAV